MAFSLSLVFWFWLWGSGVSFGSLDLVEPLENVGGGSETSEIV
jgi:hypothetical protein